MNDYISKHISKDKVERVLSKWLSNGTSMTQSPTFDVEGVIKRLGGDNDLVNIILHNFLKDIPNQIKILKKNIEIKNIEVVTRQAHTIKSMGATAGGEAFRKVAAAMEISARSGDLIAIKEALPDLDVEFEWLQEAIIEYLER